MEIRGRVALVDRRWQGESSKSNRVKRLDYIIDVKKTLIPRIKNVKKRVFHEKIKNVKNR